MSRSVAPRHHPEVRLAHLPSPPRLVAPPAVQLAMSSPPPGGSAHQRRSFRLIQTASAEPAPVAHGGKLNGDWGIQVGAFGREGEAQAAVSLAKAEAHGALGVAHPMVASVHQAHATLWRARLTGLSREAAVKACGALSRGRKNCIVLSPEAQS